MGSINETNMKNRTYYFFIDMISIEKINLIQTDLK